MPLGRLDRVLLVARWGSLTPFGSQLGLNARIEEWNAGLPCRPFRRPVTFQPFGDSAHKKQATSLATSMSNDRSLVLRRFIALCQSRIAQQNGRNIRPPVRSSVLAPGRRSGCTSAWPYPPPGQNKYSPKIRNRDKSSTPPLDVNKSFIEVAHDRRRYLDPLRVVWLQCETFAASLSPRTLRRIRAPRGRSFR